MRDSGKGGEKEVVDDGGDEEEEEEEEQKKGCPCLLTVGGGWTKKKPYKFRILLIFLFFFFPFPPPSFLVGLHLIRGFGFWLLFLLASFWIIGGGFGTSVMRNEHIYVRSGCNHLLGVFNTYFSSGLLNTMHFTP